MKDITKVWILWMGISKQEEEIVSVFTTEDKAWEVMRKLSDGKGFGYRIAPESLDAHL